MGLCRLRGSTHPTSPDQFSIANQNLIMTTYSSWLCRSIPLLLLALVSAQNDIHGVHYRGVQHSTASAAKRGLDEEDQGIFGGDIALGEEYPFFALLYRSVDDSSYVCGGTLIAPGKLLLCCFLSDGCHVHH